MYKIWVCLLAVLWACDFSSPLAQVEFQEDCWPLTDTLHCTPGAWESSSYAQASLFIDCTDEYAYRNVILYMAWNYSSGQSGDTLLRAFVVDSLGYWISPPSRDKSYRLTFAPFSSMFQEPPASLQVTQYMRDSSLCGIKQVGVLLGS